MAKQNKKSRYKRLKFLIRTNAPLWVMKAYFTLNRCHTRDNERSSIGQSYVMKKEEFKEHVKTLDFDNDWFTRNISTWLRAFDIVGLKSREHINCLEIGSWQGMSAYFTLSELPTAHLTCIDTWEGADEHKESAQSKDDNAHTSGNTLLGVEKTFDKNLSIYKERLTKYKGTSFSYFNDEFQRDEYDFIYVDGSHHCDDVIVDAIKGFEMLKVGGIMIFDDYFWGYYKRRIDNPAGAINAFLRLKRHQLEIICFDFQVVIRKIENSVRWAN